MADDDRPRHRGLVLAMLGLLVGIAAGAAATIALIALPRSAALPAAAPAAAAATAAAPPAAGPATAAAGDPEVLSRPVAVVGGVPVTLRHVEDAVLQKEGADEVRTWLGDRLAGIPWERVRDDEPLVAIAGVVLTRRDIAAKLLEKGVGAVRDDLIIQAMVEQELERTRTVVTQELLDLEYARVERKFHAELAKRNQPKVPYADWLREKRHQNVDSFKGERGFRLAAGMHALVIAEARAQLDEAALQRWFEAERARFDEPEAVDLSTIFIPYNPSGRDLDGKPLVVPTDRDALLSLYINLWDQIRRKQQTFETIWANYAKGYDRTEPGGRIGWVTRDGKRPLEDARELPAEAVAEAFRDVVGLPRLLMPAQGPHGIDLIRVNAYRQARPADFAAMRERAFAAWIEDRLEERTAAWMHRLRARADVTYKSLPELIRIRTGQEP